MPEQIAHGIAERAVLQIISPPQGIISFVEYKRIKPVMGVSNADGTEVVLVLIEMQWASESLLRWPTN